MLLVLKRTVSTTFLLRKKENYKIFFCFSYIKGLAEITCTYIIHVQYDATNTILKSSETKIMI